MPLDTPLCLDPMCLLGLANAEKHKGCIEPPAQDTRGPYSHPHKTHRVHISSPTRHTGCTQPAPLAPRFCDFQNRRFTCIGVHFSWFSTFLRVSCTWGQPRKYEFYLHGSSILQNWNDIFFTYLDCLKVKFSPVSRFSCITLASTPRNTWKSIKIHENL